MKLTSIIVLFCLFNTFSKKEYFKSYYPDGKLKEEGWILNGNKINYWFYYYENGNKKEEGHYENNQKVNWWVYYDIKQKVIRKSEFEADRLNGLTLIYSDGKLTKAEKYNYDIKVKTWTSYHEFKKDNGIFSR
jgi:antitoxin component YwqK of YwqJK toxin-antitoxin module